MPYLIHYEIIYIFEGVMSKKLQNFLTYWTPREYDLYYTAFLAIPNASLVTFALDNSNIFLNLFVARLPHKSSSGFLSLMCCGF
ncbi:hypothetical protein H5T87_03680 [bacterium]|nr:hypothetical protein [bacterium]